MSSGEVTDLNIAGSKGNTNITDNKNTNITDNKFCCKGGGSEDICQD